MKKKAIIIDLDGTLANHSHRLHYMQSKPKDWDTFFSAADGDTPNSWCVELMSAMKISGYDILIVSGRPDKIKNLSHHWLQKYKIAHDKIFFRKENDFRQDAVIKKEIFEESIMPHWDISFVVDDRVSVIEMWRSIGLVCLDCNYNLN